MGMRRYVVTGGAGFIGSSLTERLVKEGNHVTIVDNFSSGKLENISHLQNSSLLTVVREDLRKPLLLSHVVKDSDVIFHLAANPEVRVGETNPQIHFEENILTTFNLLEAVRQARTGKILVFTSTSTVYGEATTIPTPEDYGPLIPISTYGASKLASESLIDSYAYTFNHRALILRLANVVGPRSDHGVVADFAKKIAADQEQLEILGDGTQEKSYIYIEDLVDAMMHLTRVFVDSDTRVDIYNVGSEDKITVLEIAETVAEATIHSMVRLHCTGGVDGGRGWKGDVKNMQLSISKLLQTGWRPKHTSKQAVKLVAKELGRSD